MQPLPQELFEWTWTAASGTPSFLHRPSVPPGLDRVAASGARWAFHAPRTRSAGPASSSSPRMDGGHWTGTNTPRTGAHRNHP